MINILCFGDSITHGQADSEAGGWADRLKQFFFAQGCNACYQEINIFNLGIGGENSDGLRRRFGNELRARFIKGQTHLVILQYGANDIVIHKNKNIVPERYFVRNITECIEQAKQAGAMVLMLNLIPIAEITDNQINQHGELRRQSDIRHYNQILRSLADAIDCEYLDLHASCINAKYDFLAGDGLHPNSQGHEILYQAIKDKVTSILSL